MTKKEEAPKLSPTSTKKEMLDAYNALLEKVETTGRQELQPEKQKERRKTEEVVVVADGLAATSVVSEIGTLKAGINTMLAGLAEKLEAETGRYLKVKEAISAKEKELAELFEIEKSAYTFAALCDAQRQKKTEFEADMTSRRQELEEEIKKIRMAWEKEKAEYTARTKEQKEEDQKLRKREQDEYDYKFIREKEQKKNMLKDELDKLTKELSTRKEEFEKNTSAKQQELDSRETAVALREKEMADLQARVDSFPRELENAVKKAVQEATGRLTAETGKNEEILRRTFEGERNVLAAGIEALERLAAEQKRQIDFLSGQMETAYGKVQDIAVKAVSSVRDRVFTEVAPARTIQAMEQK